MESRGRESEAAGRLRICHSLLGDCKDEWPVSLLLLPPPALYLLMDPFNYLPHILVRQQARTHTGWRWYSTHADSTQTHWTLPRRSLQSINWLANDLKCIVLSEMDIIVGDILTRAAAFQFVFIVLPLLEMPVTCRWTVHYLSTVTSTKVGRSHITCNVKYYIYYTFLLIRSIFVAFSVGFFIIISLCFISFQARGGIYTPMVHIQYLYSSSIGLG